MTTELSTERLAEAVPGHWHTAEGAEMANTYAGKDRSDLGMGHLTDFELANAVYMASRNDLDLLMYQTAAKERIRWLSARLAMAEATQTLRSAVVDDAAVERACMAFDSGWVEQEPPFKEHYRKNMRAALTAVLVPAEQDEDDHVTDWQGLGLDVIEYRHKKKKPVPSALTAALVPGHVAEAGKVEPPPIWKEEGHNLQVATIQHDEFSLLEIVKVDGKSDLTLTIHVGSEERSSWDDLSITLSPREASSLAAALVQS